MRHLLPLLLFLLFTGSSTNTYSQNNNLGIHLSYNSISGLNGEVRYERMVRPRWLLSTGAAYNFRFAHSFNVGFKYDLLKSTKFSLFTGLDYKFESLQYYDLNTKRITQNSLEIPLEFRYHLSNKLSLNAGLSIPFSLDKGREAEDLFIFRFGVVRRF